MIAKVYLWANNAVTVFNEKGEQIEEYQGYLNMVRDLILCNADEKTEYYLASWQEASNKRITREEFKGAE